MRRTFWNSLVTVLLLAGAASAQEPPVRRSFMFRNEALRTAIDSLIRWYGVSIVFLERDVAGRWITAGCTDCTLDRALSEVLAPEGLRPTRIGGQIVLRAAEDDRRDGTVAVTVLDSLTDEPLQGASVILRPVLGDRPEHWGTTGTSGFFSFREVPSGQYVVQIRRVGYATTLGTVHLEGDQTIQPAFRIAPRELMQPHVTVEGRRSALGAADGVSRGVFIRSTPSDQHQYFLDGARVYNPVHAGGLTSAFNGDALRDVQSVAGGVPPAYGGRIGGILDVSLRSGSRDALRGSAELGTLGAGLVLDGPVTPTSTFLISGRQRYPDVLSSFSYPGETSADLHAGELLFGIDRRIQPQQSLSLSGFASRDAIDRMVSEGPSWHLDNAIRWNNAAGAVRWQGLADAALLFAATASASAYDFSSAHDLTAGSASPVHRSSKASVRDLSLRAHAEYFYDRYHTVLGGVEVVQHTLSSSVDPFTSQLIALSSGGSPTWELSVYAQDQWRLSSSILAELGARATSYLAGDAASSSVDPRFSLHVLVDDDRHFTGSVSAVTQYLHPYRHSGLFLYYPSIFFYSSGERIPPMTSLHGAVGYEQYMDEDRYRLAVEAYGRVTRNLHDFVADTGLAAAPSLADALILGKGTSSGIEAAIDKRTGSMTGTVRYSYSWTTHQFSELNGGRPFQPRFDRRHEFYAAATYALTPAWTLGVLTLLSTNHAPAIGSNALTAYDPEQTNGPLVGVDRAYAEPFDLNGGRLPGFQRLELRLSYAFKLMDRSVETTLRWLNGYGLIESFHWRLKSAADPRAQWSIGYEPPPLFPLYPSVNVRVVF